VEKKSSMKKKKMKMKALMKMINIIGVKKIMKKIIII
jgi:hypothetical protein